MADAISIQELIDARTDAKTLEEAVNGDAVTTVLSRLGESYPTLANALSQIDGKLDSADTQIKQAITDLFQNGGLPATPFATKALMTASTLPDDSYAMVTEDVEANNGLYVKTAGDWVKSAYDPVLLAKTYTDSLPDIIKDLYSKPTNGLGVIIDVTAGDNNAGTVNNQADGAVAIIPVIGGETYTLTAANLSNPLLAVTTRATNSTIAGASQGLLTLQNGINPANKTFTVPIDAKFALINVKYNTWDITDSLKVNKGVSISTMANAHMSHYAGAEIVDKQGRLDAISLASLKPTQSKYDKDKNAVNQYIYTDSTGGIRTQKDTLLAVMPVIGGLTYALTCADINSNILAVATRATDSTETGVTQGQVTLQVTDNPLIKTFTVPIDAKFAFINVKYGVFDISNSLQVYEGVGLMDSQRPEISTIGALHLRDEYARAEVSQLKNIITLDPSSKGKKWAAYGDSITINSSSYADVLKSRYGFTLEKAALDGAAIHRASAGETRLVLSEEFNGTYALTTQPDFITIALGTNDSPTTTMGVMTDRVTTTFYGALHVMISGVRALHPAARIGFISQIPRSNVRISSTGTDINSLKQKAVKEVCEYYSIPLWEGYKYYGFHPDDNATMKTNLMKDGLHPTALGHIWYADRLESFILSLAK